MGKMTLKDIVFDLWIRVNSLFMDHVARLLIYLVDQLKEVVYSDISKIIQRVEKPKGLPKILNDFELLGFPQGRHYVNEKLRKKMIEVINNGYINCGERFLYITDNGYEKIKGWIRPRAYNQLIINIFKYKTEEENGETKR